MGCGLSAFCKRPKRGESPNLDAPIRRNVPTPKIDHLPIADSPHDENPRPLQANIDLPAIDEESPADGPQQLPVFLTVTKKKPIGITNVVTTQIEESSYEIRDSFEDNSRQNSFYTPSYKDGCLESQQYLVLKEEIEREESQVNIDPEDIKFTPEDEQAATKIQASYRGFKTRKALETGAAIAGAEGIGFFPLQKDTQKLQASTASSNQNLSTTGSISPIVNSRDSSHEPENMRSTNGYYLLKEEASISNLNIAESSSYQVSEPEDYHKEDKENFSRLQTGDDTDPLIQDESDDEPNEYTNNCLIDFTNACEEYRQQFKVEIDPKQPVLSNKTVSENFEKENIQTIQTGNVSSNLIANHNIEPIEKSEVLMVNIENRKENAKIRNEKGVCQVNSSYSEHETHDEEKNYDNEVKNKTNTTAHYENHGFKDKDDDRQDSTKITVNAEEQVWHFKSNREIKSVLQEISDEHRNSSDMKENNGPSDKESYVVLARTVSAANNEEAYSEKIQGQVTTTTEEDFAYTGKEHNIKSGNDVEHTQDYSSSLSSGHFLPKSEARKVLSEFWNQPVRQETIKTEPKSIEADDVLQFVDDHRVSGYHQIATGYDSQFLNATSTHKSVEGMGETLEEAEDIVHDDNQPSIACSASAEELQTEINTSTDSTIPNTPQKRHKLNTERNKDSHSDNILDNMNIEMQSRESDKNTMSGYIENPPDYQTENENDNEVEIIIRNSTDLDDEIANVILTALGSGESHPCFTEASILPSPTYHEDFGDAPLIHNIPVTSSRSNVSCNDPSIQFFKIKGKNSALDQVGIVGETKLPIASDSDPECVNPIFHVSEIDLIQPNEKGTENVIKKTEEICIYAEEPSISDAEIIDYGQSIEPLEAETIDTNFSHLERKHEALQYKNTYTEVPNIRAKSCDRGINYSEIENSVIDEGISNANSLKIQPNHIVFDKKVENTEIYESQGCLRKTDRQESCYQETIKKLSQSYNSYENPKSTELLDTPLEGQIKSGQSSLADESITTTEGTENDRSFPDVEININFSRKTLESKGRQEGDDEVSTIISSDSIPPYNEQCSNSHSLLQKNTEIENSLVTDTPSIIIRADDMDEDEYIWRKLQGYSSLDEDDTYVKAVTKIQATYRGYLTRRDLENDSKKEDTTNNLDIEEDEELNLNLQESCSVLDNNEGQTNANIEKIDCLVKDSPGLRCNEEPDLIASETELLLKDKNKGTLKSRDKQRNSKGFEQSFEADNEPFDNTSLKDNIISDTDHAPAEDDSIRVFSTVKSETEYKGFVTDKTSSFYDEAQDFQTQDRNDEKKKNHYFTENQKFGEKQQETLKNEKLEESNETNLLTHIHDLQTEDSSIQVNLDSKPFSPESDDNLSKVEAAVKIQAAFRGHRTRRGVADQLSITTVETEKSAFVENAHDVIKNNAAVKIQAAFRGHKTRRELIDLLSSSAAEDGEIVKDVEIPLGKNAFDGLENEAAVKFKTDFDEQKVGKESLENNLLKNAIAQNEKNIKEVRLPLCKDEIEKEAAVKIQASFRGHMARRQLEENDSIDKFDCGTIKIVETSDSNGLDESNILFESKSTLKINETEAEDSSAHECLRQREIKIGQRDEERNSNGCKKNIDLKKKEINEDILSEDTEIQHLQKYNKRDSISDFRSQESLIQSHDLNMPNEKVPGLSKYALEVCVAAEITGNETFSETDKKTNVNTIRDDVELVPKIISDGISSKNESFSPLNIISTEDVYQPECKETSQPETYYHKKSLEQNECPEEKVLDNSEIKKQSSDVQTKDELENITVPDSETEAATNKINNDDQILIVVENLCPSREFVFVTAEFNPKSSDCDTRNEDPCVGRDQGKSLQCIKNPENFTGRDKVSDKIDYVKVPILINGKTSSQVNEKDTEIPKEKQEALTEETDRNGRDGYENNKLCTVFDKMYVNINIPDDQRLMGQKPIFPTNERSMETNTQTYSLEREHNLDSKTNGKETNDNTKLQEKPILREGNSDIQVNDKDTEPMSKFQERKVEKRDTSCCNSNIEVQAICVDQEHDLKRKLSLHLDSEDNSKLCSKEDVHDKILSTETLKKEAVSEKNLDESAISYKEILREIRNDDETNELPTQTTLENPITTGVNDMHKDIVDIQNPIINVELNPKYSFLSENEPKVQHSNRDSGIRISPKETNEFKAEFPQRIQGKIDLPCSLSKEEKEMTDNTKIESERSNKSNEETETLSEETNNKEKIADSISETHREAMEECGNNKEFNSENNFTEESKQPLENFSARKGFEDYESGTKIPSIETNYALSPNHKLNEESVDSIDFKELQPNVVPKRDVLGRDHSDGEFGNGTLFSEYVKIGVEPRERENNELKKAMTEAKVYISNKGDSIQQEAPTNENDPEHRVRIDNSEESEPQIKILRALMILR
ncbi:uncharacterized protein LOC136029470 [Artemia franciscana]|uniref:uncharacterized protein LOC136029470 n=1 Tax=Artemia franciscana TaxID=6661 RepID=UPI0032DA573C